MPARSSTPPRGHARVTARSASPVRGSASIRGVGSNNELVQAQAKSGRQLGSTWKELQDKDGKSYYHNAVKNTTQWEKPAGFDDSRSDLVHTSGSVKRRQKHIELEESADVMKMRKYRDRVRTGHAQNLALSLSRPFCEPAFTAQNLAEHFQEYGLIALNPVLPGKKNAVGCGRMLCVAGNHFDRVAYLGLHSGGGGRSRRGRCGQCDCSQD